MKTLSGAILICAASILWAVGLVVSEMYRPGATSSAYVVAVIVGCIGLFVIIVGLREETQKFP